MLFRLTYVRAEGEDFADDFFTVPTQSSSEEEERYWAIPRQGPPSVKRAVEKAIQLARQHVTKLNGKHQTTLATNFEMEHPDHRRKEGMWTSLAKTKDCILWAKAPQKQASYDFRR